MKKKERVSSFDDLNNKLNFGEKIKQTDESLFYRAENFAENLHADQQVKTLLRKNIIYGLGSSLALHFQSLKADILNHKLNPTSTTSN